MGVEVGLGAAILGSALGASTVYQAYSSNKAGQDQRSAQRKAIAQSEAAASAAEQASNKANAKRPDTMAILDAARLAGKQGLSGTLLTGAGGVDPSSLALGKSTLLGM